MQTNTQRVAVAAGVGAILVGGTLSVPIALTPELRDRLMAALGERFDSDVEIHRLRVSILPRLRVAGDGVVLRHKGRTDVPPLISVESFAAEADISGLLGEQLRLRRVELAGLEINVPPGGVDIDDEDDGEVDDPGDERVGRAVDPNRSESPLIVDHLVSERAVLRMLRRKPGKTPRVFNIHHLVMRDTGSYVPWRFEATLSNPTPPGEIEAEGTFGPWNADVPSETPLGARYEFRNADLGDFDGIRGELHSSGEFAGVLERIDVEGKASVMEFGLTHAGHRMPLDTTFQAVVDGTNGNTWLKPVHGRFLNTSLRATGGVIEGEGEDGHTVQLDVAMPGGRLEDVLRLAVKGDPPMTGTIRLDTRLVLPPGDADAEDRLQLDGSFHIARARFPKGGIQAQVNELSRKARGPETHDQAADDVASDFTGRFVMRSGVIRFRDLSFAVPGARVSLAGRYTLDSEALDFQGTVRLDAKPSELTTGIKSFFLKLVDPLVRRDGVTVVPITVRGTVEKPDFRLDVRRALLP